MDLFTFWQENMLGVGKYQNRGWQIKRERDYNKNILWHSNKKEELSQSYNIYIYIYIRAVSLTR